MCSKNVIFCVLLIEMIFISTIYGGLTKGELDSDLFDMKLEMGDLADLLREVIEHFKLHDPVGLPGIPIPDPMPTPDIKYTASFGTTLHLKKSKIHGLSKFKIERIYSNLNSLEMEFMFSYKKLELLGTYKGTSFLSSVNNYNLTLGDVKMAGLAFFDTTRDGRLETSSLELDLEVGAIELDFENPGFLLSVIRSMMNHIGGFIFKQIKPYVLAEMNVYLKKAIQELLNNVKWYFPDSIPPLDLFVAEGRKYAVENALDPLPVEDYVHTTSFYTITVNNIQMLGLANFYRVGNITVSVKSNTVTVDSHVSTQQLEGKCKWKASMGTFLSTYGVASFTVQYVRVRTRVNQTLDLRNTPELEEIDVSLGNIQLRTEGLGTVDYALELFVNVLPNLLRNQIMTGVKGILKKRIQNVLNDIDVEDLVEKHVITNLENIMAPNKTYINPESSYEIDQFKSNVSDLTDLYDEIFS